MLLLKLFSLKQLDDADHRKLQSLIQWDKDCGDTVSWLRANRSRFKMEVFEPAMLSIMIPDQRFMASVEACINQNDLKVRTGSTCVFLLC